MRYKEVHSIRAAREKITELKDRIEATKDVIEMIRGDGYLVDYDFEALNRRIGQFKRYINFLTAEIQLMEKLNKSYSERIY